MTFRSSLRTRIIVAFCLFSAVLGTVYALAVYLALDFIDDRLIDKRLQEEVEYVLANHREHGDFPRSRFPYMTVAVGRAGLPVALREVAGDLPLGTHEVHRGDAEYHIAIRYLPEQQNLLFLIYYATAQEFTEERKMAILFVLAGGIILVVFLGLWIGLGTSRKVIAPVVHLADQVEHFGPGNLPVDLSKDFFQDEVGSLARALEQAMQRIKAFIEREQLFSRDASHELRTPVAVIKGAVEALKRNSNGEDASLRRPLERIERSVAEMESIIEGLLYLGREESSFAEHDAGAVLPVVLETVEQTQALIGRKQVSLEYEVVEQPQGWVPTVLFRIALSNLIQNAVQHTPSGVIRVLVRNDRVLVLDSGPGMEQETLLKADQAYFRTVRSSGFGLGLSIVKRLCDRLGWDFDLKSRPGSGTQAELIFRPTHI